MKKVILAICVVALLLTVASAAMASSTYWIVQFLPGYWNGASLSNSGLVTIGAGTTASSPLAAAPSNNAANIAALSGGNWLGTDRRLASAGVPMSFTLGLATGSQYPQSQVYVSLYSPDKYLSITGRSLPVDYTLTVKNLDGSVVYGSWTGADLLLAAAPATGSRGPVGFWYTPAARADSWAGVTAADEFTVIVDAPVVPEPGSLMALGSGLVGLVGFAIRRRRA